MGYSMHLRDARFGIRAADRAGALAAIRALADRPSFRERGVPRFAWINDATVLRTVRTLREALAAWGWEIAEEDAGEGPPGDVTGIDFVTEKLGDEDILFGAIAPFVVPGSYIEMGGEEEEVWRWVFRDGRCDRVYATLTWPGEGAGGGGGDDGDDDESGGWPGTG